MENTKIKNLLTFYVVATQLKDTIRSGWKVWNIRRERIESVAEHIYGTCILAIAIDSEFDLGIDLKKVIMMLVIHELEEIEMGDLTPFDQMTKEQRREKGKVAVIQVLSPLTKKEEYIAIIEEFETMETKEALFAKMCDKLEADLQAKLYCEQNCLDIHQKENELLLQEVKIQKLMKQGASTISDLFIENDRPIYTEKVFEQIANVIEKADLQSLLAENKRKEEIG